MKWTDEMCVELERLWGEGHSARWCAEFLGHGLTRNAIIGKAARLCLPSRVTVTYFRVPRKTSAQLRIKRRKTEPSPRQVEPTIAPEPVVFTASTWQPLPGSRPVSLLELTEATCKWCVVDPFSDEKAMFCGQPVEPGRSWCKEHSVRASGKGTPSERTAVKEAKRAARYERNWARAA